MPHAVVAVDERHARGFARYLDLRLDVDGPALDAADVLRQPENAVAFGALHVGARHHFADDFRVGGRHIDRFHGAGNERFQLFRREPAGGR